MNKEEVLGAFLLAHIPEIITQEEFDNVQSAIKELLKENQELKNRLEEKENRQKDFIEYLDCELNVCVGFLDAIKNDLEEISYVGRISGKTYIATQIVKKRINKEMLQRNIIKI